jgi:TRAP-type C4-dicarboxylate transport system permease small subunit
MDTAKSALNVSTRAFDKLLNACYYFAGLCVALVTLFVAWEVFVRYALNSPTQWVLQGSEYGLVYIAFIAAAPILRDGGHTKMTILLERMGPRNSRYVDVITNFVGVAICTLFSWQTMTRLMESIDRGAVYKEGFDINQSVIWWVMPFAFITMGIQFIRLTMEGAYEIKNDIVSVPGDATHGMA